MEEIWKDIPEYEGRYQVSNLGNVLNKRTGRLLNPFDRQPNTPRARYLTVHLGSRHLGKRFMNKSVHSLVMLAFVGERPENYVIHHKDHNPSNNILDNLVYCTQSENRLHDFKDGAQSFLGSKNNSAIINEISVLEIVGLRINKKMTLRSIGEIYGLSTTGVSSIMNGHTWSHITGIENKHTKHEII